MMSMNIQYDKQKVTTMWFVLNAAKVKVQS